MHFRVGGGLDYHGNHITRQKTWLRVSLYDFRLMKTLNNCLTDRTQTFHLAFISTASAFIQDNWILRMFFLCCISLDHLDVVLASNLSYSCCNRRMHLFMYVWVHVYIGFPILKHFPTPNCQVVQSNHWLSWRPLTYIVSPIRAFQKPLVNLYLSFFLSFFLSISNTLNIHFIYKIRWWLV